MPIPITPEEEEVTNVFGGCLENCIFCDKPTRFWYLPTNRPCCPQCSVTHDVEDIDSAEFNY